MLYVDYERLRRERSRAILQHTTQHNPLGEIADDLKRFDDELKRIRVEMEATDDIETIIYYEKFLLGLPPINTMLTHHVSEATYYRRLAKVKKNISD